jgi:hypothetical protein
MPRAVSTRRCSTSKRSSTATIQLAMMHQNSQRNKNMFRSVALVLGLRHPIFLGILFPLKGIRLSRLDVGFQQLTYSQFPCLTFFPLSAFLGIIHFSCSASVFFHQTCGSFF